MVVWTQRVYTHRYKESSDVETCRVVMMKFPLCIPPGWRVILTQGFSDKHEAIDVIVGTPQYQEWATYGAKIVCPFPLAEMVSSDPGTDPNDMKAGRFQIQCTLPDGTQLVMGGLHCSEVVNKRYFNEGDVVAYIGNGGFVSPQATKEDAYAGGHLHLSYTVRPLGQNAISVDPLLMFDINDPYRGADSGFAYDIKPIAWAMNWTKEKVAAILKMVGGA